MAYICVVLNPAGGGWLTRRIDWNAYFPRLEPRETRGTRRGESRNLLLCCPRRGSDVLCADPDPKATPVVTFQRVEYEGAWP